MQEPKRDLKEGLSSGRKADITHCRTPFLVYTSRPCSYGSVKYERSNFIRPVNGGAPEPTAEDFNRFRAYLRAAASHIFQVLDAMEHHQSQDPDLVDVEGMKRAAYAVDTDTTPGAKVGASLLPHVAPACASLNMAITQAVEYGLLPADPGETWIVDGQAKAIAAASEAAAIKLSYAKQDAYLATLAAKPKRQARRNGGRL